LESSVIGPYAVPELTPQQIEERKKRARIDAIAAAMSDAPRTYSLADWVGLSEHAVVQAYARAVEPLLKEAGEKGAWV